MVLTVLKCFNKTLMKPPFLPIWKRRFLSTEKLDDKLHCCKILVVGGGTGGCAVAAKFAKNFIKCDIIVLEPSDIHYYQPSYSLIGAGVTTLRNSLKPTIAALPENVTWFKDSAEFFCPFECSVVTKTKKIIKYEYMVISTGMEFDFDKIKGLKEALDKYDNVVTIASPQYAEKTYCGLNKFSCGIAVFTHPKELSKYNSLNMCFLAEHYWRMNGKLCGTKIFYLTAACEIFPVNKYATSVNKLVKKKNIVACLERNLIEINPKDKTATFEEVQNPKERSCMKYDFLHVTPPMKPVEAIKKSKEISNEHGFVDVNKGTLQHNTFQNIFALGDCASLPTSKTVFATNAQAIVVHKNLTSYMTGRKLKACYDGYAASPIITGYGTCILAEYDYKLHSKETLPIRQERESKFAYYIRKDLLPKLYWNWLLTGKYPRTAGFGKLFSWYKKK
ncbi:sulfide:quinone oxidoreductase, mitochondrial-like [Onthophagus taurus]|uniref:sulfide:quinone oxidoreductase, mitochondrial-like n=1 Tax=Onthophagus taurus TaxID=166361 RepID=UPI0039BDF97E